MDFCFLKTVLAGARRFACSDHGGPVIIFALALPVLLLATGAAVDYGYLYLRQSALQQAADAAALDGAKELLLANADEDVIASLAEASVAVNLHEKSEGVAVTTRLAAEARTVSVAIRQTVDLFILDGLADLDSFEIAAASTARVAGDMPICMLILETGSRAALALNNKSRITGVECAVHSNSNSSSGIAAFRDSMLSSRLTCTAGGYKGDTENFEPRPLTDCPPIDDPLAARRSPPAGKCTEKGLKITDGRHTLFPGTYCDGLAIGGKADVVFSPGVYVIQDGQLSVSGTARVRGEHVGFYLVGRNATFGFQPQTSVDLSAPKDGLLAGILFFEDRSNKELQKHVIRSNGARSLVGTFYLPQGELTIDATKPLFDRSAYTVIIARRMNMFSGPNLVLNSEYDNTDVPLPPELEGASGHGEKVLLAK